MASDPAGALDAPGPRLDGAIARASYAEDCAPDGTPRPGYRATMAALPAADLPALSVAIQADLREHGVTFGGEPFVVDAVPRLISGQEWDELAAGLTQRARALNAFLHDAYGEQRIVAAGLVTAEVVTGAEGYEPDLAGRLPLGAPPAGVMGFDIVRDTDGTFLVLEDNLRTPSGIAYALAARGALTRTLPDGLPVPRPIEPVVFDLLTAAFSRRSAGPRAGRRGGAHRRARQRGVPRARADRPADRVAAGHHR